MAGDLVPEPQLDEMQVTVPAEETAAFFPGAAYGLGLMRRPLRCGGVYWSHGGDGFGCATREGVTADGKRSAAIYLASTPAAPGLDAVVEREMLANALIQNALCDGED